MFSAYQCPLAIVLSQQQPYNVFLILFNTYMHDYPLLSFGNFSFQLLGLFYSSDKKWIIYADSHLFLVFFFYAK